jgi:hypothetical protein
MPAQARKLERPHFNRVQGFNMQDQQAAESVGSDTGLHF